MKRRRRRNKKRDFPIKSKMGNRDNQISKHTPLLISIYLLSSVAVFTIFSMKFFSLPDITNFYIENSVKWIYNLEVFTNIAIMGTFFYFGYNYFNDTKKQKDIFILIFALLLVLIVQLLAFRSGVDINGDNGNYIYAGKSIATLGEAYDITSPSRSPDLISIGLPLLIAIAYKLFGMNLIVFKVMLVILSFSSALILYFSITRLSNKNLAAMVCLLYALHSYTIVFASMIMTETATLFWSILSWYFLIRFVESENVNYYFLSALVISSVLTYLTRTIGISLILAIIIYLFLKTNFFEIVRNPKKAKILTQASRKFLYFTFWAVFLLVLIQIRAKIHFGQTETGMIFQIDILEKLTKSIRVFFLSIADVLAPANIVRWNMTPLGIVKIAVEIVLGVGLFWGLKKKSFSAIYFLVFAVILVIVTPVSDSPLVLSRYLVPTIPFAIFIFSYGLIICFKNFNKTRRIFVVLGLSFLLSSSLIGNGYLIQKSHIGQRYPEAIKNYFDCALWIKKNLPSDVIVESRKSRIFYIFAESYSVSSVNGGTKFDSQFEKDILYKIDNKQIDLLVVDSFSGASARSYIPLINKYPKRFNLIKVFGEDSPSYLFEVL